MLQGAKSTVRGITDRSSSYLQPQTGQHVEWHVAMKMIVLHGLIIQQIKIAIYEKVIVVNLTDMVQLEV